MDGREQITTAGFALAASDVTRRASRDTAETELIEIALHHSYWQERRRAARYLAGHQSRPAIETLIRVVRDDRDDEVVEAAILALLKLRAFEALEMLTKPKVLSAAAATVRWAGVHALGELGNPLHFDYLLTLTHDPDWLVRNEALATLERLITHINETISPENQPVETLNLLIRMLRIDQRDLHQKIVAGLGRFQKEVLENVLIEALHTHDEQIKVGLAMTLGNIKSQNAVARLVEVVQDHFGSVRKAALHALAQIGGPAAINAILLRLGDGAKDVVDEASRALIALGEQPYAQAILIDSLRHLFNVEIKRKILAIMGQIKHPALLEAIIENLGNSYFFIRASATEALVRFGAAAIPKVTEILAVTPIPVATLIAEALEARQIQTRIKAIQALGVLKNSAALETAKELSQTADDHIASAAQQAYFEITKGIWERANAAYVLGEFGDPQAVPLLIATLQDESTRIRTAVLGALRKLRDERAIEPVARLATADPDGRIRTEAVAALVGIGFFPAAVKTALLQALHDEQPDVRVEAARGLGKIPDDDVVDALLSKLPDDSFGVRRNVLNALYTIGKRIAPKVTALLETTPEKVSKGSALILSGVLLIQESIPLIERLLQAETDPDLLAIGRQVLQGLKGDLKVKALLFEMYLS